MPAVAQQVPSTPTPVAVEPPPPPAVWAAALGQTLVACIRLPAIFTAIVGLVVVALILLVFGTLNTDETLTKAAGYVVFAFAALGIYAFLGAAWVATGGKPLPLGPRLVH